MGLRMAQQPDARRHVQLAGLSLGCRPRRPDGPEHRPRERRRELRARAHLQRRRQRAAQGGLGVGRALGGRRGHGRGELAQPPRFGGQTSIVIAAGGEAVSDPVALKVQPLQTLAVNVYLPQDRADHAALLCGTGQLPRLGQPDRERRRQAVHTEDLVLDGRVGRRRQGLAGRRRHPDHARRLDHGWIPVDKERQPSLPRLASRSASPAGRPTSPWRTPGSSGTSCSPSVPSSSSGSSPVPARPARDVLTQPGARAIILLAGINDIGDRSAKAADLIPAVQQTVQPARAAGQDSTGIPSRQPVERHWRVYAERWRAGGDG